MTVDAILAKLRALRDETGDTHLVAYVRVVFGLLLVNEAWLATQHLRAPGFFGNYFHQPMFSEAWVPSESVYSGIVLLQWLAGVAIVTGRFARPALLVAAWALVYTMLSDRLWFHHYRHTMAAFAALLAFTPCDRHLVLGEAGEEGPGPLWAANAMKAQVSVMYLASGGSKLFDPDWRGGVMMRGMISAFARLVHARGLPVEWIQAVETPLGASLLAKGAISTELGLAIFLWLPQTRRAALWVGLGFHLFISLITPVQLFTAEMLAVYMVFVTPDREARVLRFDPERHRFAGIVEAFDWLGRYKSEEAKGGAFAVIDRGGVELHGLPAAACVFGTVPVLFPLWPLIAIVARVTRGRAAQPRSG
ncbi:MAG TPA: HTTM domain-containing protein [Polyangiaceae bacterium]|jgi:uncharacterized membrane protein YphA (DoxX/SURF4 family)|nr:HTTM domain-containing protein [Polyangiaceae bacterium]